MIKKVLLTACVAAFLSSSAVMAEFNEGELPVWGMINDTAYTLNEGEWNIDLWGPVTYGVVDGLQVGSVFWFWFAQIPNVYGKFNLLQEGPGIPAISLGGFYRNFSFTNTSGSEDVKVSINWYGIQAMLSKQLSETLYLSGGYIYNGVDGSGSFSVDDSPFLSISGSGNSHQGVASLVTQMSKRTRFSVEVLADINDNLGETNVDFAAGGGFEWAMGKTFRLKIGVFSYFREEPFYVPFLDLHWRFK